jgi:putative peptidoglycan lipid II flippase
MSDLRGARTMAMGTVASRATGFLRAATLAAVLGVSGVLDPFTLANTVPNIVFELLIGGILTSAAVPLLVRANQEGHGQAYIQRLLTLALLVLGAASALLVVFAPQVVDIYANASWDEQDRELAITFARYFLPQVLFYGLGALVGAYLNTQGRFGPPMWAPVLNNLIVLATLLVFTLMPGPGELTAGSITTAQIRVLGIGVTLGVVAQTVALLPALRATGLRLTPRFDFRGTGLGAAAALAKWTLVYVVCNQIAYAVVVKLATDDSLGDGAYASYVLAFTLWQLPHAIVAVSVITALLPRLSQAHLDQRPADLRTEVDRGLRLAISLLVPAAVAYLVLGRPIATLVFGNGETSAAEARTIGTVLAVFACGLVAFSSYQLQLRAFYAMQDTRTPAVINLAVNVTMVAVDVVLFLVLPDDLKLIGLAVGQAASYVVGVVVCSRVLAERLPRDPSGHVLRTAARCVLATLPAAAVALAVTLLSERYLPSGLGALTATVVGSAVLLVGYVSGARRLGVDEVEELVGPVQRKILSALPGSRGAS